MKRPLKPEDLRVWGVVAATVHPLPGRETPLPSPSWGGSSGEATGVGKAGSNAPPGPDSPTRPSLRSGHPPHKGEGKRVHPPHKGEETKAIEPNRQHRIVKEREEIGARLDLHGFDQDRARLVLEDFLRRAWDEGYRAVLVITGKGVKGDGVLRRRAPEWLAARRLAPIVAGISEAHRRHGGEGALYVALKRKPRG
jgi:DNA-nicking Smr family endonuclease